MINHYKILSEEGERVGKGRERKGGRGCDIAIIQKSNLFLSVDMVSDNLDKCTYFLNYTDYYFYLLRDN